MSETSKPTGGAVDLSGEKIHWDQEMSYGQYLSLDTLLNSQPTQSNEHDEMLFIIIHQTSELWMKLSLHELSAALKLVRSDELRPSFKMLSRVARIQAQLLQSWEVLATLTPSDYMLFRDKLGKSSGFQSHQYRALEFTIGNKNARMIEAHRAHPETYEHLKGILNQPSLYDETIRLLAKRGFDVPSDYLDRDWSQPYVPSKDIENIWLEIYRNPDKYWDLYELAEKLVDLEYHFQRWRFTHMKTVERIIGFKQGTGGTAGVSYLVKALDLKFFPELWTVRTAI